MSTTEEHHYEVLVTVTDGFIVDFDINDEPSATWWDGMVYNSQAEEWTTHGRWDNLAMSMMFKIQEKIKKSYSLPTIGSYCLMWQGHILEAFISLEEAEEQKALMVREILNGERRDFLDPEDLDDDNEILVQFVRGVQ